MSTKKIVLIVLAVLLVGLGVLVYGFLSYFNLIPGVDTYAPKEVKKTEVLVENIEKYYRLTLPESATSLNYTYWPNFSDPMMHLWFTVAEEDFESMFNDEFWSKTDTPEISYDTEFLGFECAGSMYFDRSSILEEGLYFVSLEYSCSMDGIVSVHLGGNAGLGAK